jgi:hypothetical protein
MHSPKALLIISKRKIAGPELPDFGGESFETARKGAIMAESPCPPDDPAPESQDEEPIGYSDQLVRMKTLASELVDISEQLEKASKMHKKQSESLQELSEGLQEGSGTGEPDKMDSKGTHGAAKVFPPAE